jgi:hypothetical protein
MSKTLSETDLLSIVNEKMKNEQNMIRQNNIINFMAIKKLWLCGTGLWVISTSWTGIREKSFFPFNKTGTYSTVREILLILSKRLY